jgi:hypothetical protein
MYRTNYLFEDPNSSNKHRPYLTANTLYLNNKTRKNDCVRLPVWRRAGISPPPVVLLVAVGNETGSQCQESELRWRGPLAVGPLVIGESHNENSEL